MNAEVSFSGTRNSGLVADRFGAVKAATSRILGRAVWCAFDGILVSTLYFGWINRNERHWTPEHGFGYWLGIAGGVAMLVLLLYPLRKRWQWLRFIGAVPFWFQFHMALGLLAPCLILLHCNFKSDSMNASIALYSMLIVAGSGLVGRYLYGHIYSSLAGRRIDAVSFFEEATEEMAAISDAQNLLSVTGKNFEDLSKLTQRAVEPKRSVLGAIAHRLQIGRDARSLTRTMSRDARRQQKASPAARALSGRQRRKQLRQFEEQIDLHFDAVRKAASLAVYERLFALWHLLHLPLFVMLVGAVVVHILAVHLY